MTFLICTTNKLYLEIIETQEMWNSMLGGGLVLCLFVCFLQEGSVKCCKLFHCNVLLDCGGSILRTVIMQNSGK